MCHFYKSQLLSRPDNNSFLRKTLLFWDSGDTFFGTPGTPLLIFQPNFAWIHLAVVYHTLWNSYLNVQTLLQTTTLHQPPFNTATLPMVVSIIQSINCQSEPQKHICLLHLTRLYWNKLGLLVPARIQGCKSWERIQLLWLNNSINS